MLPLAQEEFESDTLIFEEEFIEEEEEEIILEEEELMEEEIYLEEEVIEEAVEEIVEKPSKFKPGWTVKVYVNGGPIEPWQTTGGIFDMGIKAQVGAQLNISNWLSLPTVLKPLTAEVMAGYTTFNGKETTVPDASTSIISFALNGRYDLYDLIARYIGFENPAISFFGIAGLQYNTQSWDVPTREFDSASAFGMNFGVGIKLKAIDIRFVQSNFVMGDG